MENEPERGDSGMLEERSFDDLFSAAYEELRRLAWAVKSNDSSLTLNPTALVHEVWLKLSKSPPFATTSPLHFKRIAARAMREVLIDAARRRNASKRGREAMFVTLSDSIGGRSTCAEDLLALNEALDELGEFEPRQVMVVECRFFAGLNVSETAEALEVSESVIHREWRAAKAWLSAKLSQGK